MKKNILVAILFSTAFFASAISVNPVFADTTCNGQYGNNCVINNSISVNKLVAKPLMEKGSLQACDNNINFYDNFSPSDIANRFSPLSFACFKLTVRNTSNVNLMSVTVNDYVPSYINPVEGPGSFDSNTRIIAFNAGDFGLNEEKTYFFKMQVLAQNLLPSDKGLFCIVNKAYAFNSVVSDSDTAQLCIEKQVAAVVQTPASGPEMGIPLLAGEVTMLGIGLLLKKRIG